jgi:hypothetical protein
MEMVAVLVERYAQSCRTNTSSNPFVSPDTRLVALLANAENRPSAEMVEWRVLVPLL